LLDRIDMHVEVPRVDISRLVATEREVRSRGAEGGSAAARARVCDARARQDARAGKPNSALSPREVVRDCVLGADGRQLMQQALTRLALSARAYHRILKVARTIADLACAERISVQHLSEAVGYRRLDRGST
jgi:magnesium chelatase family protein